MSFPIGDFFIRNIATGLVLDVAEGATDPGSRVIFWTRNPSSGHNNQLWRHDNGFLVNRASNLVLEVPGYGGGGTIAPGTRLVVNIRRGVPNNLNQSWTYQDRLLRPFDRSVAITAENRSTGAAAVVDSYQPGNPDFMWSFDILGSVAAVDSQDGAGVAVDNA